MSNQDIEKKRETEDDDKCTKKRHESQQICHGSYFINAH